MSDELRSRTRREKKKPAGPDGGGVPRSGRNCPPEGGADLVLLLASGASAAEAGRRAGCSERTVRRRLEAPGFRAEVASVRVGLLEAATGRLAASATEAVNALRRLLQDRNGAVAVAAARTILSGVVALREHSELAQRIGMLEEAVAARRNGAADRWQAATVSAAHAPEESG